MIPDPIERMECRFESLAFEYNLAQYDVPKNHFRCPFCRQIFSGEPIQSGPNPDSAACCYDCLPDDIKAAHDKFMEQLDDA